jgi:hypothetical protein
MSMLDLAVSSCGSYNGALEEFALAMPHDSGR